MSEKRWICLGFIELVFVSNEFLSKIHQRLEIHSSSSLHSPLSRPPSVLPLSLRRGGLYSAYQLCVSLIKLEGLLDDPPNVFIKIGVY